TLLTTANGLPSNNGWSFRVVDGYLYVSGIEGVWRLPLDALPAPGTETAHPLSPEMVLSASGRQRGSQRIRCCNGGATARSAVDGDSIWLPTISGALRLDTRAIVSVQQPPSVVVEGLRYGRQWYAAGGVPRLVGGGRDVEIEFTGLSFRDPRSLRFRYRLEGYDDGWVDAGVQHFIQICRPAIIRSTCKPCCRTASPAARTACSPSACRRAGTSARGSPWRSARAGS